MLSHIGIFLCAKYIAFLLIGDQKPFPTAHGAYSPDTFAQISSVL